MKTGSSIEKEWLRRMNSNNPAVRDDIKEAPLRAAAETGESAIAETKKGNGFKDVAGMDELKQLVTEGFINVLNNRECAQATGGRFRIFQKTHDRLMKFGTLYNKRTKTK